MPKAESSTCRFQWQRPEDLLEAVGYPREECELLELQSRDSWSQVLAHSTHYRRPRQNISTQLTSNAWWRVREAQWLSLLLWPASTSAGPGLGQQSEPGLQLGALGSASPCDMRRVTLRHCVVPGDSGVPVPFSATPSIGDIYFISSRTP